MRPKLHRERLNREAHAGTPLHPRIDKVVDYLLMGRLMLGAKGDAWPPLT